MHYGDNGILKGAEYAVDKYQNEADKEQSELDKFLSYLNGTQLPENTPDTDAGTVVKTPSNWGIITPNYTSTENGEIITKSTKIASVYAVSDGEGQTIPVPKGFFYVGGTLNTGVVISDKEQDSYKKNGRDMTSHEDAEKLIGNQFVWIPCTRQDYVKKDWGQENAKWDMTTNPMEYKQIERYGGFYIGRYEAGVSTYNVNTSKWEDSVTFAEGKSLYNAVAIQTGVVSTWTMQNYDYIAREEGTPVTSGTNKASGKVVVKANSIPYYHADYYTAVEMSGRLYTGKDTTVQSMLVTGTQWDAMMKFIAEGDNSKVTSIDWGNYDNTSLTNLRGFYTNVTTAGATDGFKSVEGALTSTNSCVLLTTGATEQVKKKNLYDVAGNLWEWTQEAAYVNGVSYNNNAMQNTSILRGGSFSPAYGTYPTSFRAYGCTFNAYTAYGFRLALYME